MACKWQCSGPKRFCGWNCSEPNRFEKGYTDIRTCLWSSAQWSTVGTSNPKQWSKNLHNSNVLITYHSHPSIPSLASPSPDCAWAAPPLSSSPSLSLSVCLTYLSLGCHQDGTEARFHYCGHTIRKPYIYTKLSILIFCYDLCGLLKTGCVLYD